MRFTFRYLITFKFILLSTTLIFGQALKYLENDSIRIPYNSAPSDGYICVYNKILNKYGFIDYSGKLLIPFKYELANDFVEGNSIVKIDGKYGLIDKEQNYIIKPTYWNLRINKNNKIIAAKDLLYGVINFNEEILIPYMYDDLISSENNSFLYRQNGNYGVKVVDKSYPLNISVKRFKEVQNDAFIVTDSNNKYYLIDPLGEIIMKEYDFLKFISNDLILVGKDKRKGLASVNGEIIDSIKYDDLELSIDGKLFTVRKSKKYGYIDKTGNLTIPMIFDEANRFKNSSAVVRYSGKFGVINENGEYIIEPIYDRIKSYTKPNIFVLEINDTINILNKDLTPFSKHTFLQKGGLMKMSYAYKDGLMKVKHDSLIGYIDETGNYAIEPKFKNASDFTKGFARILSDHNSKYGVINKSGTLILPYEYDKVDIRRNSSIVAKKGITTSYLEGGRIIFENIEGEFIESKHNHLVIRKGEYVSVLDSNKNSILPDSILEAKLTYDYPSVKYRINDNWGYSDLITKETIIPCKYDEIQSLFNGQVIVVKSNGMYGIYNSKGILVSDIEFTSFKADITMDGVITEKDGKYGLYDRKANLVLNTQYDQIDKLGNLKFNAQKNGINEIIDLYQRK